MQENFQHITRNGFQKSKKKPMKQNKQDNTRGSVFYSFRQYIIEKNTAMENVEIY